MKTHTPRQTSTRAPRKRVLLLLAVLAVAVPVQAEKPLADFEDIQGSSVAVWAPPRCRAEWNVEQGSLRMDWTLSTADQWPMAVIYWNLKPTESAALPRFKGVRFKAKGTPGVYKFLLSATNTMAEYNHYSTFFNLAGSDWETVEIRFDDTVQLWGSSRSRELSSVTALAWDYGDNHDGSGFLLLDDLTLLAAGDFKTADPGIPLYPEPKTNQVGYRPDSLKLVSITGGRELKGKPFRLIDDKTGQAVFQGILTGPVDDTASSGERVCTGDFTRFTTPGRYRIEADGKSSHPFTIAPEVWALTWNQALKTYALNRCGTAVNDPVTGIRHPPCHLEIEADTGTEKRDFHGGWHNAGDYGVWTHMAAFSIHSMLTLADWQAGGLLSVDMDRQTLLEEARWGLDWLLRMQNSDGSVYHKVDSDPLFAQGYPPELDPTPRMARFGAIGDNTPSTLDAGWFVAVMFQASRVLKADNPVLAETCRRAALKTLKWLETHPGHGQFDTWYTDPDDTGEQAWAMAEAWRETGEEKYLKRFLELTARGRLEHPNWSNPLVLGYETLLEDPRLPENTRKKLLADYRNMADHYLNITETNGYGSALDSGEYWWGSNQAIASRGNVLVRAWLLTGDKKYLAAGERQLHWLLGQNSLDLSFVTGEGSRAVSQPFHWAYMSGKIVLPGWLTGGANGLPSGPLGQSDYRATRLKSRGTPPAKCFADYADRSGSWTTNEGTTDGEASWLLLCGFFAWHTGE
jgi:endoglucanase